MRPRHPAASAEPAAVAALDLSPTASADADVRRRAWVLTHLLTRRGGTRRTPATWREGRDSRNLPDLQEHDTTRPRDSSRPPHNPEVEVRNQSARQRTTA